MSRDPWQPIETAPKDLEILVAIVDGEHCSQHVAIDYGGWFTTSPMGFTEDIPTPTHWMKLPDPPEPA